MSAETLLREIEVCGVSARAVGDELKLRVPRGALDARVLDKIRAAKPEIIALLQAREYSQPRILSALEIFREAVESARRDDNLIQMSAEITSLWRAAESEVGHTLTLRGEKRGDPLPSTRD